HFLRRFNRELNRDVRMICPETMATLYAYSWPGNVRELQSVLKQALLDATGSALLPTFLPDVLSSDNSDNAVGEAGADDYTLFQEFIHQRLKAGSIDLLAESQVELDRLLLPAVLRFTNGQQRRAAHILGIARQTLRQRLRGIGLNLTKHEEE